MEKLIITVACDSRTSYPINHLCPPQEDIAGVAQQYIDGINAGAAIAHIHGRRTLEESMQADGKQVSIIHHEGWKALQETILAKTEPVMQFGVASARLAETRARGYAVDRAENMPGSYCLAAPIFDAGNRPIGAIGLSGRALDPLIDHSDMVRHTAEVISHHLL